MAKTVDTASIIRTERGLTIAGTRITLYSIMDYLLAGWPPPLIRDQFDLTEQQITAVMAYIETHRDVVEAEYRQVLHEAAEARRYWEARNQEQATQRTVQSLTPEHATLRAKIAAHKAKLHQP